MYLHFFFLMIRRPPRSTRTYTLFPYTTLFRSSLTIGITKQSTANPLDLSKEARKEVELINQNLPAGMKLNISYDTSVFIQESINSVYHTVAEAIILVVLVIFFFLQIGRAHV